MKHNAHTTNLRRQMQRWQTPARRVPANVITPPAETWTVASRQQIRTLVQNALKEKAA